MAQFYPWLALVAFLVVCFGAAVSFASVLNFTIWRLNS
jgi:hypothetical protein